MNKLLDQYKIIVATIPEITLKGKTIPYTSLNGHMFSYLSKDGFIAIRLPKEEREKFISKYKTKNPVQYGAVMKEYVIIPEKMLSKTSEVEKYFKKSLQYIKTLKPKPTKRK